MSARIRIMILLSGFLVFLGCAGHDTPPPRVEVPQPEQTAATERAPGAGDMAAEKTASENSDQTAPVKAETVNAAEDRIAEKAEDAQKQQLTPEQLYSAMLALEDLGRVRARRLPHTFRTMQYLPDTTGVSDTGTRLGEITGEIAGKVFYELKEEGQEVFSSRIAVVAAVPLADFKKETEFGRLVAEYLLTDLADRGLKVTELRLGRDINILPRTGEFLMSRNPGELASNFQELDYVVISTFSNTRKSLILQGRLVSLKSGLVISAWRHTLPLNRELMGLFATAGREPYRISVRGMAR